MSDKPHRGTIFVEDAELIAQQAFAAEQYLLRLRAPKTAAAARAGQFVHVSCDANVPLRRPLSIMHADHAQGWIEVLFKASGPGLGALAHKQIGERFSLMGPIGNGFTPHPERPRAVLIGGGYGIPPMLHLAEHLRTRNDAAWKPLVLLGSELPFPFRLRPSTIMVAGMPAGVIASLVSLDEVGIPARLASWNDAPGCHHGFVTDLAAAWLQTLDTATLDEVELFVCGPTPLLKTAAQIARRFNVAAQVSMEEYMACATGGCAGCAVKITTPQGPIMKRVCVDGPVFDAYAAFAD